MARSAVAMVSRRLALERSSRVVISVACWARQSLFFGGVRMEVSGGYG